MNTFDKFFSVILLVGAVCLVNIHNNTSIYAILNACNAVFTRKFTILKANV